ncbi:hypothetical protein GQX74_002313 [Glossina fuscipes]|nr:hypothetical protein GQX74_002313 [Glossina fuscipes]
MNENLMKQPLTVVPLSVQNKRIVIGFDGNIETLNTLLANAAHDDGVGSSIYAANTYNDGCKYLFRRSSLKAFLCRKILPTNSFAFSLALDFVCEVQVVEKRLILSSFEYLTVA